MKELQSVARDAAENVSPQARPGRWGAEGFRQVRRQQLPVQNHQAQSHGYPRGHQTVTYQISVVQIREPQGKRHLLSVRSDS